jgi:hypothetical protein
MKDQSSDPGTAVDKGYIVDRTSVTEFISSLELSEIISSAIINSLNRQTENIPDDIPSKFNDQLYRFSIELMVKQ